MKRNYHFILPFSLRRRLGRCASSIPTSLSGSWTRRWGWSSPRQSPCSGEVTDLHADSRTSPPPLFLNIVWFYGSVSVQNATSSVRSAFIDSGSSILGWIPIRDPYQSGSRSGSGSRFLMTKNWKKCKAENFFPSFFIQNCYLPYFSLGLHEGRLSYRRNR